MAKQILLNAFNMNCIGHINHGLWTHPRDTSTQYKTLDYWTNLARLLERGLTTDGAAAAAPHDPARPITRNRQPGRCCDTGCTTPGQPVMVDLPVPVAKKQN